MKFYKILFCIGIVCYILMLALYFAVRLTVDEYFSYEPMFYFIPVIFTTVGALGWGTKEDK